MSLYIYTYVYVLQAILESVEVLDGLLKITEGLINRDTYGG